MTTFAYLNKSLAMKSITIRYILKHSTKKPELRTKKETIYARINGGFAKYVNGIRKYENFDLSLEAKIKPQHFGILKKNNFIYDEVTFQRFVKLNVAVRTKMNLLDIAIDKTKNHFEINHIEPTKDIFKKELLISLKRSEREKNVTFTILEYLLNQLNNFRIDDNSKKSYVTLSKYIVKYQTVKDIVLTFDNFDKEMYIDFWNVQDDILSGLITIPKVEGERKQNIKPNGFLKSAISKYQKCFKRILNDAQKEKIKILIDLNDKYLVEAETESSKNIYINEVELKKVINYNPTSKELKEAKDYIILASVTGMRYESMIDAFNVKIQVYKDDNYYFDYIHSRQNKTSTECIIPLLSPAKKILKSYNNIFPEFSDNGTLNGYLKILFTVLNINSKAILTYDTFKRGVIIEEKTVNEIISSHDLRKSFASNLLNLNVSQAQIDDVTHPDKKKKNAMATVYDKRDMLDKAKLFVDEIKKAKSSEIYKF
jgi:hypothetical protein